MTAEQELAPILAELQSTNAVVPFFDARLPAERAAFRRLPDIMVDLLTAMPDFIPPQRGSMATKIRLGIVGEKDINIIIARPRSDGELWVIAPREIGT